MSCLGSDGGGLGCCEGGGIVGKGGGLEGRGWVGTPTLHFFHSTYFIICYAQFQPRVRGEGVGDHLDQPPQSIPLPNLDSCPLRSPTRTAVVQLSEHHSWDPALPLPCHRLRVKHLRIAITAAPITTEPLQRSPQVANQPQWVRIGPLLEKKGF